MDITSALSGYAQHAGGVAGALSSAAGFGGSSAVSGAERAYGRDSGGQAAGRTSGDTVSISQEARDFFANAVNQSRTTEKQAQAMAASVMSLGADATSSSQTGNSAQGATVRADAADAQPTQTAQALQPPENPGDANTAGQEDAQAGNDSGRGAENNAADNAEREDQTYSQRLQEMHSQMQGLETLLESIEGGPGHPETKSMQSVPVQNKMRQLEDSVELLQSNRRQGRPTGVGRGMF